MRLLISALISYQLLLSIANGQNNTASETAAADNTQKALITVAVLGGACIIAVVVAKLVDYCYDRHVSVSDNASDISEHTRDLIRLRLTISAFTRGGEKKKIQLTSKEDASAKQKKLIRIWSTKAKESRLIAEKIRAADMAKSQLTAVNKNNNNNKDNSVTNSHSSNNTNNDIIIRVEAAACDGPLLAAESGSVVTNGGTPAGVDKSKLHPPAASSEPHQLHSVGSQGAQTATKDSESHTVDNSNNKTTSSSGRRRSLSPPKLPAARPASKAPYPSRTDLQEVTSSKRPSVHFDNGNVQAAAVADSPDKMSYSDERNQQGTSDIVDHSNTKNDVSLLKSQEGGVNSSGKSYSSKTPNNKVTPTEVKSLNTRPTSPKVGRTDKNVNNASKSISLDEKRLQYQGNNQVPLGDHSLPVLHEKKSELPEDTGTSTFITSQDRRLPVTPESVSKADVSSSSVTVGVKVSQASGRGITKSNVSPTRIAAKTETESRRNLKSNILGATISVDKTIKNSAILQTKKKERSESVGHENKISSPTSRQISVNPLQVHKANETEAAKLDKGSSFVEVMPAATTSLGRNSAAEAQAGSSTYTKAKFKIEEETEKQKLPMRMKSPKSENANKFKPTSPSARDRLKSGKSDKRGDVSEDGLRGQKATVTSPTHSTNADVVAAYTSAVNDIRLNARPKSSFLQTDSSSGVESKIAAAAAVYQKASEELQVHRAIVSLKKKAAIEASAASAESSIAPQATAQSGVHSVTAAQNLRQAMAIKKLRSQSAKT